MNIYDYILLQRFMLWLPPSNPSFLPPFLLPYLQIQHRQPGRLLTPIVIPALSPHALIPARTEGLIAFPCLTRK